MQASIWTRRTILCVLMALPLACTAFAETPTSSPQIERGRALFKSRGCYECHGFVGQGAFAVGPPLVPLRLTAAAVTSYIRRPSGQMPPYSAKLLPANEVEAIVAFLHSLPRGRSAQEIPLLAPYVAADAGAVPKAGGSASPAESKPGNASEGAMVYRQFCASCHGANLEGGVAPALRGRATLSASQVASAVRNPPQGMPKLFPGALSEAQLAAVAAYVSALTVKTEKAPLDH
jgi:ubiquinol-cytochrome c reductase cytochrome c subunit